MSKELVQQLAPVLWDVDPATVDPERHAGFLVQRVRDERLTDHGPSEGARVLKGLV